MLCHEDCPLEEECDSCKSCIYFRLDGSGELYPDPCGKCCTEGTDNPCMWQGKEPRQ
jgi:hypothetical protein